VAAAVLIIATVAGAIGWFAAQSTVARPRVSRFVIALPSTAALTTSGVSRDVALTPDGSRLIYVGANGTTLFLRLLDQREATPLVSNSTPIHPFVSPDGQWVGFFDGPQTLRKVSLTGGPAVLVARLRDVGVGATWAVDGTIIFGTATTGLQRVSAD